MHQCVKSAKSPSAWLIFTPLLILTSLLLGSCRTIPEQEGEMLTPRRIMEPAPEIRITRWYGDAPAACSLTFDDGTLDHYQTAYPILQEYDIKGTFFLMAASRDEGWWNDYGQMRRLLSWDQAAEMGRTGHEIGSHSLNHGDIRAVNGQKDEAEILALEFYGSILEIKKKTGITARTFAWPYWRYSPRGADVVLSPFIAARTGSIYPSKITDQSDDELIRPRLPGAVPSYALLPNQKISEWLSLGDEIYNRGGWLTLCLHGVRKPGIPEESLGWEPLPEEVFRSIIDYLKSKEIWTAPFGEVYQYIIQRDKGMIEITEFTPPRLTVDLCLPIEYTSPPVPVTLEILLPDAWNGNIYSADGTVIIRQRDANRILADLIPLPPSDKGRKTFGF